MGIRENTRFIHTQIPCLHPIDTEKLAEVHRLHEYNDSLHHFEQV